MSKTLQRIIVWGMSIIMVLLLSLSAGDVFKKRQPKVQRRRIDIQIDTLYKKMPDSSYESIIEDLLKYTDNY